MKTTGQKARKTVNKTIKTAAKKIAEEKGISLKDAQVMSHKQYWDVIVAKRKATMAAKVQMIGRKDRLKAAPAAPVKDLAFISENKNKKILYAMLLAEAWELDDGVDAITMPSVSKDFETLLIDGPMMSYVGSFTFLERDAATAEVISENFKDVPHNLVIGNFPDTTNDLRQAYPQANFVWLDFMGVYLSRYSDEIEILVNSSIREEMVLAITIGNRGPSGTNNPNEVFSMLNPIFSKAGWSIEHKFPYFYKSDNVSMNCLVMKIVNPNNKGKTLIDVKNQARKEEIERELTELKRELEQLNEPNFQPKVSNLEGLTSGQRAWATRRARYGSLGRRNKDYRPRNNS